MSTNCEEEVIDPDALLECTLMRTVMLKGDRLSVTYSRAYTRAEAWEDLVRNPPAQATGNDPWKGSHGTVWKWTMRVTRTAHVTTEQATIFRGPTKSFISKDGAYRDAATRYLKERRAYADANHFALVRDRVARLMERSDDRGLAPQQYQPSPKTRRSRRDHVNRLNLRTNRSEGVD